MLDVATRATQVPARDTIERISQSLCFDMFLCHLAGNASNPFDSLGCSSCFIFFKVAIMQLDTRIGRGTGNPSTISNWLPFVTLSTCLSPTPSKGR